MTITPVELEALMNSTVDRQQEWIEALIFEKLGFNYGKATYMSSGTYSILFPQSYDSGIDVSDIDIRIKAFTADGEDIGGQIKNVTYLGFDVFVSSACKFDYIAFQPKLVVPL